MKINITHADCYDFLRTLPDGSVDIVLSDPPYGGLSLKWDVVIDYCKLFPEIWRVSKPGAAVILFHQQPYATDVINAARKEFRYEIIWKKTQALGYLAAKKFPLRQHENILIFCRKTPPYYPVMWKKPSAKKGAVRKGRARIYQGYNQSPDRIKTSWKDSGLRYPTSVIDFSNNSGVVFGVGASENHATAKPVDLMRYLIRTYSKEGDTVLDMFSGSGSTAVGCIHEGRNFTGCELDEGFHKASLVRVQRYAHLFNS